MGHWIYIVMELCVKNLRQYVEELGRKPLDMKTFVSIFNQLLNGLEYLHDNKILHRYIKPNNIFITGSGEMKLSDFGISKPIESDRTEVSQTRYGVGSDGYRPPESYVESCKLTTAADIFSLAIVVIHLISNGRHPFGSNPYDWSYNIRNNRNLDLSLIPQHILRSKRAQLIDLAAAMLKSDPRDRPSVKQIKSHDFFKDTSSTRVKKYKAKKSSNRKQMDAEANKKISDQKATSDSLQASVPSPSGAIGTSTESRERSKKFLQDSTQLSDKRKFQNILRVAEFQLTKNDDDSAIKRVEDFLSKESTSAMDVKNMADGLKGKGHYVQAMILYKISHDLHKKEGSFSPDNELEWIRCRIDNIHSGISPLLASGGTSRKIVIKIAKKFLEQFLKDIREVKDTNNNKKVRTEIFCAAKITFLDRPPLFFQRSQSRR